MGVIYRHLFIDLTDFNCNHLNELLENISKEQRSIFLLGDFNVNLLNYNEHNQTNNFLDSFFYNSFIPLILQPTSHSDTLIYNIFPNAIDPGKISGNLNMFGDISGNKSHIHEKDWSKFDRENFILD